MDIKQRVIETIKALPPDKQQEVLDFAEFLRNKDKGVEKQPRRSLLGALANLNIHVTDEDIREARREMWRGYMREDFK